MEESSTRERLDNFIKEEQERARLEKEGNGDEDYDSDDPENWGPYYWSENQQSKDEGASIKDKVVDNAKYYTFKGYRNVNFAGEVLIHFFGLNQSKYQWVIDQVEREAEEEEENERFYLERQQYLKEQKLKKDLKEDENIAQSLEGGQ